MFACAGRPSAVPGDPAARPAPAGVYTLVTLTTGAATDLDDDAKRQAFAGHFRNMGELADRGVLLVAGPYRTTTDVLDLRGLFVLDTPDVDEALRVASTDPAVQAGVFALSAVQMVTDAPLREVLEADRIARAANEPPEGQPDLDNLRSYVIAVAPLDDARASWAATAPGVVLIAVTRGPTDELLLWLDAEDERRAQALLAGGPVGADGWTLRGWFGTKSIATLGRPPTTP